MTTSRFWYYNRVSPSSLSHFMITLWLEREKTVKIVAMKPKRDMVDPLDLVIVV
ncbi:hypothetical protein EYZ11_003309 [Aspergillus tanneri]|uniref:Uncharacterized protein n=1 Tax=Aspergillus tanneri TaxID=1220188 RepID=A0A4S3JP33_9EURO|nr:hypothetical protein EYZ11_003309 [Aspergillus tanneri]